MMTRCMVLLVAMGISGGCLSGSGLGLAGAAGGMADAAAGMSSPSMRIAAVVVPDVYEVTVSRKDSNLYKVEFTKLYVRTRYCYEYAFNEEAILKYQRGSIENVLVFRPGKAGSASCQVTELLQQD